MAGIKEVKSEEEAQDSVEPRLKASLCVWRQAFSRTCALFIFPVCAIVDSLVLVSLAFKTPRPGVSLGFSFLLFILAMIYFAVANTVRFWLPDSEHEHHGGDFDSKSDETDISVVVVL